GVQNLQALDTVFLAFFQEGVELGFFLLRFSDDKFTGGAVRNIVLGAKFLGQTIAFHTVAGFPGISRVVDTGVDDAAIARAGGHPELGILLDEKDVLPAAGEGIGEAATDYAAANNQNVDLVHN